jgi:anti-sigma factor RsiW
MKCIEADRLMSAILDGDLPGSPRLESHLEGCESCALRWEALRRTVSDVQALAGTPAPARLTPRIMAALSADAAEEGGRRLATLIAASSMVLASLVAIAWLWAAGLGEGVTTFFLTASEALLSFVFALRDHLAADSAGYATLVFIWAGILATGLVGVAAVGRICAGFVAARRGVGEHGSA